MSSAQRPLVRPMKIGNIVERAIAYRNRAEELRTIAEETIDEDCRVALLRLAQCYDRMAVTTEAVLPVPTGAEQASAPIRRAAE